MTTNDPGKRIKEICSLLGEPYIVRIIDRENVIYRKFDHYELEVSRLDNSKSDPKPIVYVWAVTGGRRLVETIEVSTIRTLKQVLDDTTQKYLLAPALSEE